MVARSFRAFDSEAFLIDGNSPFGSPGDPIINNSSTPDGTIFEFQSGFTRQDIVLDDTGGDDDEFEDGNPSGHIITQGSGIVANGTGVEAESVIFVRALDENDNQTGPTIRLTVFSQGGNVSDVWGFSADNFLSAGTRYVKTSGSNNGTSEYEDFIPCFVAGTRIRTPDGAALVENLNPGDRVWTQRNPAASVRWVGSTEVVGSGALAPVRFEAGSVGSNHDLLVSPQHRMVVSGAGTELLFSSQTVLVPAIHLVGLPGVTRYETNLVTYVHLMFDQHEIVEANGRLTESFFPGDHALRAAGSDLRNELLGLFPELVSQGTITVAPCLNRQDAMAMRAYMNDESRLFRR